MIFYTGIAAYWPILVVVIVGVILAVIALLALLLLRNQNDFPRIMGNRMFTGRTNKNSDWKKRASVRVTFYRIGTYPEEKSVVLRCEQWINVGSGKNADFCLNSEDRKMADIHFRICVGETKILVSSLESETFINGVPIRQLGTVAMESGDLIRAGGCEYRVIFSPCREKGSKA